MIKYLSWIIASSHTKVSSFPCPSLCLFKFLSVCLLSLCLCVYLSLCLFLYLYLCLLSLCIFFLFVSLSIYLISSLSICLISSLYICLFVCFSICLFVSCLFLHLSLSNRCFIFWYILWKYRFLWFLRILRCGDVQISSKSSFVGIFLRETPRYRLCCMSKK